MEALHDRRRALDSAWARRKAQIEQALAVALLAAELSALDSTLKVRHEALARSDQLGDSASSAELLLHEHNKLLPEAKVKSYASSISWYNTAIDSYGFLMA